MTTTVGHNHDRRVWNCPVRVCKLSGGRADRRAIPTLVSESAFRIDAGVRRSLTAQRRLDARSPCLLVARRRDELEAGRLAASGEVQALGVKPDRPPDLPAGGLASGKSGDRLVAEPVDPVDQTRLRIGQRRLGVARDQNVGRRQRVGATEAAVEVNGLDGKPEKGEIGEVDIELRLGIALEIARANPRALRPFGPGRSA